MNGCIGYFHDKDAWMPPNIPPQDQGVEWFRLNSLHHYVKREMPILGIGYSAYLIFAEVLGGRLSHGKDGMDIGTTTHKIIREDGGFYSYEEGAPVCAGLYESDPDGEDIVATAERLLKHGRMGGLLTTAPVPKKPIQV